MRERAINAAFYSSTGVSPTLASMTEPNLLYQNGTNDLPIGSLTADPVTREVLGNDPTHPDAAGSLFEPVFEMDVITDPSEARGVAPRMVDSGANPSSDVTVKPPGLIHPDDWNPTVQYRANADGYIFYGNNAVGGWKPQIVRVTDNFLALRVRNVGDLGEVGVLTHIVLAPRKRTAGRINVNTVETRVAEVGADQEFFSTLLGLPGVVDVARTVQPGNSAQFLAAPIGPGDAVTLRSATSTTVVNPATGLIDWRQPERRPFSPLALTFYDAGPVPPTRNQFSGDLFNPDTDLLVPVDNTLSNEDEHAIGAFRLGAMLMGGRTEHADGRYYESIGALVSDTSAFDYNYGRSRADVPDLAGLYNDGVEDLAIYPLSNESDPAKRFDEVQSRIRRLGNSVTTRSDVYEIIMTVEAGYGVDKNQDGFVNYRDPSEFVTTARTKATAIYERRAPSDQSDGIE